MFYVYEWFNINTNEVFYIGKGTGRRYKVKNRNQDFNQYIRENEVDVRIVSYFEDEEESFLYEEKLIQQYLNDGYNLCNRRYGGCGGCSSVWTEEARMRMSINNPMKDEFQRARMSEFNPMKNPETARKVGDKISKSIFIGDKIYKSQVEASQCLGYKSPNTIRHWLIKGESPMGEKCGYVSYDNQQPS